MSYQQKVNLYALASLAVVAIILTMLFVLPEKPENAGADYAGLIFSMLFIPIVVLEFLGLFGTAIVMRLKGRKRARLYREAGKTEQAIETTTEYDHKANVFFLASSLVLLVGCSLCFGGAFAVGSI